MRLGILPANQRWNSGQGVINTMKKLLLCLVCVLSFLVMRNPVSAQSYQYSELQKGTPITVANIDNLVVNALASGDATVVVSTETASQWLKPAQATSMIKFDVTVAGTVTSTYNLDWTVHLPLEHVNRLSFATYWGPASVTGGWNLNVYVSETSAYANRYNFLPISISPNVFRAGEWNSTTLDMNTPNTITGTPSRTMVMQRIRMNIAIPASVTGTIYISPIYANYINTPSVMLVFDDGTSSQYATAFKYMQKKNLVGALAITSGTTQLTTPQYQDLATAGWSFHNHSATHADLSVLTQAQVLTELQTCNTYLSQRGLAYGNTTLVYPFGFTSANAIAAAKQAGFTHGVILRQQIEKNWTGLDNPFKISRYLMDTTTNLAAITALVEQAKTFQGSLLFVIHRVLVGATSSDTELSMFTGFMDYLAAEQNAGRIQVLALQDWVNRMENTPYKRTIY